MKKKILLIVFSLILFTTGLTGQNSFQTQQQYFQPTFESLEKVNPVPEWFNDAKFGICFHWEGILFLPMPMNGIPG